MIFPKVKILNDREFEKTMGDEVLANRGLADFPDMATRKLFLEFLRVFAGFYSWRYETIYVKNGCFSLHILVHEYIHHVAKKLNLYKFLSSLLHKLEYRKAEPIEMSIYLDGDSNRD